MPQLPKALFATCDVVPGPTRDSAISQVALQVLSRHFQVDAITLKAPHLGHHEKNDRLRMMRIPAGKGDYLAQVDSFRRALLRQLEGEEYHLVHVRSLLVGAGIAKKKAEFGVKLLVEVSRVDSLEVPILHPQIGGNRASMERILADEDLCLKEADAIVAPSRVLRDLLAERGRRDNLHLIPDGVNVDVFDWLNAKSPASPILLYVGSLTPWQGLVTLIEALEILSRTTPVRLVIVHPGNDEHWQNPLKNLANNLGVSEKIEFRSAAPEEIPEILSQASICIAPYAKVGRNLNQGHFPLKVIEYMACRRPIVASRLSMVEEVLSDNQEGLLFQPGNAEDLSQKIQVLLQDKPLAQRLSENAYRKVRESFTAASTRRRYSDIYRGLWEAAKEEFPRSGLEVGVERDDDDIRTVGTDAGSQAPSSSSKKRPAREEERHNNFQDNEATAIFSMSIIEEERPLKSFQEDITNQKLEAISLPQKKEPAPPSPAAKPEAKKDGLDGLSKMLAAQAKEAEKPSRLEMIQKLPTALVQTIASKPEPPAKPKESPTLPNTVPKSEPSPLPRINTGANQLVSPSKPKDTPARLEVAQAKEKPDISSLLAKLKEQNKGGS